MIGSEFGVAMAVADYSEKDWDRIRAVSKDFTPETKTYPEWKHKREGLLSDLEKQGRRYEVFTVDFDNITEWLRGRNMVNDKKGRVKYIESMVDGRYLSLKRENVSYVIFD